MSLEDFDQNLVSLLSSHLESRDIIALSLASKTFYEKFAQPRYDLFDLYYQEESDTWDEVGRTLDSLVRERRRKENNSLEQWKVSHGEPLLSEVFPWRKPKLLSMSYIRNPRGLDMEVWYVNGERTQYTTY